ncbi:uncharacterized protein BX663DRAFT_472518 [Cokeromyces recurvatus]|uniref:uncharacterized protein n=1 Tax=Cokeromyces recurvatus TaxID=90255 RepID=UPI00221E703C|nr:uncharacterized protein BX663DRAFT_472518 [Cokeromyces recurvatus]KAI7902929.1 hypothetical protein BX663DRAFT_472518 [Cokeromyces recurvatus]
MKIVVAYCNSCFLKLIVLLLLVCSWVVVSEPFSSLEAQQLQLIQQASKFEILQDFRKPKRIAFSAFFGGASHVNWVLTILDELSTRDHSTFFITNEEHLKFGKSFPNIETLLSDTCIMSPDQRPNMVKMFRSAPAMESLHALITVLSSAFEDSFLHLIHYFKTYEIDLALCDHFNSACAEASHFLGIPYIITSSTALGPDTATPYINNEFHTIRHPTIQTMSFWERFDKSIIKPFEIPLKLYKVLATHKEKLHTLGIRDPPMNPEDRWRSAVKLVNSCFGFEPGRPIGPLVEFIGPILHTKTAPLTQDLVDFLDSHNRVVYVAFGQHAIATTEDLNLIMNALLNTYKNGDIDGIIWATRHLNFPPYFKISNVTYDLGSFYGNHSDILFLSWAPQLSILKHDAVKTFVTHGGAGSLYEALYAGVRLIIYPFFIDQPGAALTAQRNGLGLKLDSRATQQEANDIIKQVVSDVNHTFQKNVDKFKALVQIRANRGPQRGADVVEEVLFMDGQIKYRFDVRERMSFVKVYNIDVYAFMCIVIYSIGRTIIGLCKFCQRKYSSIHHKSKIL